MRTPQERSERGAQRRSCTGPSGAGAIPVEAPFSGACADAILEDARCARARRAAVAGWLGKAVIAYILAGMVPGPVPLLAALRSVAGWTTVALLLWQAAATFRQRRATRQLAKLDDVRAVPALIEALDYCGPLGFEDRGIRRVARDGLVRLLPRLQATDSRLLDQRHRDRLKSILTGEYRLLVTPALVIGVLKAMEQVGGEEMLEPVGRLARGKGWARKRPAVQEAAEQCLLVLRGRIERERAPERLLRPAGPPGEATLLRPRLRSEAPAVEGLLRPTDAE